MTASAILVSLCLARPVQAAQAASHTPAVNVELSEGARKLLDAHGMTLEGGILRRRGERDGYDLVDGSGTVCAVVHPKDPEALAVALYGEGVRYAEFKVTLEDSGPALSPLADVDEETLKEIFPADPPGTEASPEFDLDGSSDALSACVLSKLSRDEEAVSTPKESDPCQGRTGVLADCILVKLRRQRDETLVSSPEESDPCYGRVDCSSAAVSADLRRLYIEHLGSMPGDEVGRAAAEFLRTSSVNVAVVDLEARMVPGVWGIYDSTLDEIEFHNRLFKPLWAGVKGSRLPPEAADVVERTTPGLAHELRHARMDHELGFEEPGFRETESLAYADMALFLWARLERDPDYEGMGTFNGILLSTAGFPAPAAKWWKEPLKTAELDRLFKYTPAAKSLMGGALTEHTSSDWFLVRSLAGGLAGLEANIAWFQGSTVSAFESQRDFLAERAKAVERQIADRGYCLELEEDPGGRLYLERLIRRLERFRKFYAEPESYPRLLEYYRRERAWQQAEIDRRLKT